MSRKPDGVSEQTVRIQVTVEDGRLMYLYGGQLPTLEEGAIGDLIVPHFARRADDVRQALLAQQEMKLLPGAAN